MRQYRRNRRNRMAVVGLLLWVVLVVTLVRAIEPGVKSRPELVDRPAEVTWTYVNFREDPEVNMKDNILTQLKLGEKVVLTGNQVEFLLEDDRWLEVVYKGETGWVFADAIRIEWEKGVGPDRNHTFPHFTI